MVKKQPASTGDVRDMGSLPGLGRFPWHRKWQPTPVFLPEESHEQRSLAGYSPRGHRESDITHKGLHGRVLSGGPVAFPNI